MFEIIVLLEHIMMSNCQLLCCLFEEKQNNLEFFHPSFLFHMMAEDRFYFYFILELR